MGLLIIRRTILIYFSFENIKHLGTTKHFNPVTLMLVYLYFVRLDVELEGVGIALLMESIFLALAGFLGVYGWYYAEKNNLTSGTLTVEERDKAYLKMLPEPITSVLTIPFAFFGPNIWTAAWLLMIPVSMITKRVRAKMKKPD